MKIILGVLAGIILLMIFGIIGSSQQPAQTQAPPASLATLKAQVTPTLTTATTYLVNLYAKVQSDAAMSDAMNANSAFYHDFANVQSGAAKGEAVYHYDPFNYDKSTFDTKPDFSVRNAYVTASNAYSDAQQEPPDSLYDWDADAEQLYSDITEWTTSKFYDLAGQRYNTVYHTHQYELSAAAQAYKSDLAKAQADIMAL